MVRTGIRAAGWLLVIIASAGWAQVAHSYPGATHQQLMFLAARQYNECVKDVPDLRLSALQVRYAAKAAVSQAESSFMRRMFRWGFYEREEQSPKSSLWVIETRMHEHFNSLVEEAESAESDAEWFPVAGRIAGYVQDVTSPVRVVPIYSARFWRFNTHDRFTAVKVQEEQLADALTDVCDSVLTDTVLDYSTILKATADQSLAAIRQPIPGMPTTWQSFWRLASDPSDFGEYGPAGNRFGARTSFRCGDERCVLLNKDPLYEEFAQARHVDAVVGTMRVLHSLQMRRLGLKKVADADASTATANPQEDAETENTESQDTDAEDTESEDAASSMARSQIRNLTANE